MNKDVIPYARSFINFSRYASSLFSVVFMVVILSFFSCKATTNILNITMWKGRYANFYFIQGSWHWSSPSLFINITEKYNAETEIQYKYTQKGCDKVSIAYKYMSIESIYQKSVSAQVMMDVQHWASGFLQYQSVKQAKHC